MDVYCWSGVLLRLQPELKSCNRPAAAGFRLPENATQCRVQFKAEDWKEKKKWVGGGRQTAQSKHVYLSH